LCQPPGRARRLTISTAATCARPALSACRCSLSDPAAADVPWWRQPAHDQEGAGIPPKRVLGFQVAVAGASSCISPPFGLNETVVVRRYIASWIARSALEAGQGEEVVGPDSIRKGAKVGGCDPTGVTTQSPSLTDQRAGRQLPGRWEVGYTRSIAPYCVSAAASIAARRGLVQALRNTSPLRAPWA
jgi:hypothetical protein